MGAEFCPQRAMLLCFPPSDARLGFGAARALARCLRGKNEAETRAARTVEAPARSARSLTRERSQAGRGGGGIARCGPAVSRRGAWQL